MARQKNKSNQLEALGDIPEKIKENEFKKNFATDQSVVDRFWEQVSRAIPNARMNRRAKEECWLEDLRLWACNLTDGHQYAGRANMFIPELHHQVESSVDKYLAGLFPSEDYLGVTPLKNTDDATAQNIKAAVYDQLQNRVKLPLLFDIHGRQRTLFGTSPLRCSYVDKPLTIFTKGPDGIPRPTVVPRYRGVLWESVDLFRFYVTNEMGTMDDPGIIFEDNFVPKQELVDAKDQDGRPLYAHMDEIREIDAQFDDHQWVDLLRLEANLIYNAAEMRKGQVYTTTVYMDFDIKPGVFVPIQAMIANNNTVIQLRRNPFYFQAPPYLTGFYKRWPVKNFYGMSLPDRIRSFQYQMNDVSNQTMDSMAYSLNPIAMIDPALAGDQNSFILQPGAKWFASPDGVKFAQFPDISSSGFQAMGQIRGMVSQFSDNATGIAPQLQGKARSATQASVVDREVSRDLRISTRHEELEVMVPMCHMTHLLLQQYQSVPFQIMVQGPDKGAWIAKGVRPEDLIGDVDFTWYGATIAEQNAVRNQQMMNLMQLSLQMRQAIPELSSKLDLVGFFERIVKENFSMDRAEEILVDLRQKKTVDQELENIALMEGQDIQINDGDDDDEHLSEIHSFMDENKKMTVRQKLAFLRHAERHEMQKKAKEQVKANDAKIQAMQMAMSAQNGQGQPGQPGQQPGQQQGGPKQMGPGNLGQMPEATNEDDMARGMRGVEPNMM